MTKMVIKGVFMNTKNLIALIFLSTTSFTLAMNEDYNKVNDQKNQITKYGNLYQEIPTTNNNVPPVLKKTLIDIKKNNEEELKEKLNQENLTKKRKFEEQREKEALQKKEKLYTFIKTLFKNDSNNSTLKPSLNEIEDILNRSISSENIFTKIFDEGENTSVTQEELNNTMDKFAKKLKKDRRNTFITDCLCVTCCIITSPIWCPPVTLCGIITQLK